MFRYLILISKDFYNFISLFILSLNFDWKDTSREHFSDQICKHLNVSIVKSNPLHIKYSTLFPMFWNVVKHRVSGFHLLPNSERAIFFRDFEPFVNVVCKCLSFNCFKFFCYLFTYKLNFCPFVSFKPSSLLLFATRTKFLCFLSKLTPVRGWKPWWK